MRIALDVSQTCSQKAGCGWIALQIAKTITKHAREDRKIVLYHQFGNWINANTDGGFFVEDPNIASPFKNISCDEAKYLWQSRSSSSITLPENPDIVHSHNFSAPNTGNTPLVYTVHDLAFWDIPDATTEANRLLCQDGVLEGLKHADAFIFPSEFTKARFLDYFSDILCENELLYKVVNWAGRFTAATEIKTTSETAPWLFVGSLDPRKNLHNLLQAHESYCQESSQPRHLVIAGPKGWKNESEAKHIESLEKRGLAKHLGYLEDSALKQLYRDSFALVWPSFYEGFGLPIVEAMSQGTPVITSRNSSLNEVGGDAAIYCDPHSPSSICRAMLQLEENPEQYPSHSLRSLKESQRFSWDNSAAMLLDFYEEVISSSKKCRSK